MNICFVYPECENLGVEYLSACLKKSGHNVRLVFDPRLFENYYFESAGLGKIFSYTDEVVRGVLKSGCELVCFSVFSDYYGWACRVAAALKKRNKDLKIIFGGIHPTSVPDQVIKAPFIDYVCVGEGEYALTELADALGSGGDDTRIKNIWAKKGGHVFTNEPRPLIADLDTLPFPDKEIFKNERFYFSCNDYKIVTSRGCPNACAYCYNSHLREVYRGKGRYLRKRGVGDVIRELEGIVGRCDIDRVTFYDDIFITDLLWLEEFAAEYKEKIKLPYFCNVHASYVNPRTVQLLKESGCLVVTMGIQTSDENLRRNVLGRSETNQDVADAIKLLTEAGIFLYVDMIFGLPLQDEEIMRKDVSFINTHRTDVVTGNWLRYYPKTRIIQVAKNNLLLSDPEIVEIEQSGEYQAFSQKGSTYTKNGERLRNMLVLACFFPEKATSYILKKRLYRFLPAFQMMFYLQLLLAARSLLVKGKRLPFVCLSPKSVAGFYLHYICKRIKLLFLPG